MTDWNPYELIVDLSIYEPKVDYQRLADSGVMGFIARAGKGDYYIDPTGPTHCQGAYDVDRPFGFYWVHDPLVDNNHIETDEGQLTKMKQAFTNKRFHFLALDVEIWQYRDANNQLITIPDVLISETARVLAAKMRNTFGVPVIIYSSYTIINDHIKPMINWLTTQDYELWLAYYPFSTSLVNTTWDVVKTLIPPTINTKYLHIGNIPTWTIWQFNDKFVLPGITDVNNLPTAGDVNLFNIAKGTFAQWCNYKLPEPPPPPPPPPPDPDGELADIKVRLEAVEADLRDLKSTLREWAS